MLGIIVQICVLWTDSESIKWNFYHNYYFINLCNKICISFKGNALWFIITEDEKNQWGGIWIIIRELRNSRRQPNHSSFPQYTYTTTRSKGVSLSLHGMLYSLIGVSLTTHLSCKIIKTGCSVVKIECIDLWSIGCQFQGQLIIYFGSDVMFSTGSVYSIVGAMGH